MIGPWYLRWSVHLGFCHTETTLTTVSTQFTATVSSVLMTVAVHEGLSQHIWKLEPEQSLNAVTYSWIAQAFSIFTFAISKISISLFLLLRVVGAARLLWHKSFLYSVMISLPLVNSVIVILVFTQCRPVQRLFDPASPGHCWNPQITTVYAQFGGGMYITSFSGGRTDSCPTDGFSQRSLP